MTSGPSTLGPLSPHRLSSLGRRGRSWEGRKEDSVKGKRSILTPHPPSRRVRGAGTWEETP